MTVCASSSLPSWRSNRFSGSARSLSSASAPPVSNSSRLLLAEREALADEPRLVGVEDRAVPRPDLHAHDRLAQDLALDDVVDPGERLRVTGEHAVVAERRRLDQLAFDLDALARVALGLLGRDPAQREEAADQDHRDRGEAAEQEPGDGGRDPRRCGLSHRHCVTTMVAVRFGPLAQKGATHDTHPARRNNRVQVEFTHTSRARRSRRQTLIR